MSLNLYYIALTQLGIDNELVRVIMSELNNDEIVELYNGKYSELQFTHNINFTKYSKIFGNEKILEDSLIKSQSIINKNKELKIKAVSYNSRFYPKNIKSIKNPPAIIYYKGHGMFKKEEKSIGCTGTREPTKMGIRAASSLIASLTREGFAIVSGLADGTDTCCHIACLENNGETIAVLSHGLDMIYPKQNEKLASDILQKGGTLVSEYPVGTRPEKFRFIQRNRIITGLSKGVIVFEAKEKSGTMHTVDFAIEQGKKLFAPVPIENVEQTRGIVKLLSDNRAIPIHTKNNYDIIVTELGYKLKDKQKAKQVESQHILNLFTNSDISVDTLINYVISDTTKRTSADIDSSIYEKFKNIIKSYNISVKDILNAFILSVVNSYDKKA